jgi:hypothetical protein
VGLLVGNSVGADETGSFVGRREGADDTGIIVGTCVGLFDGLFVGLDVFGAAVGLSVSRMASYLKKASESEQALPVVLLI